MKRTKKVLSYVLSFLMILSVFTCVKGIDKVHAEDDDGFTIIDMRTLENQQTFIFGGGNYILTSGGEEINKQINFCLHDTGEYNIILRDLVIVANTDSSALGFNNECGEMTVNIYAEGNVSIEADNFPGIYANSTQYAGKTTFNFGAIGAEGTLKSNSRKTNQSIGLRIFELRDDQKTPSVEYPDANSVTASLEIGMIPCSNIDTLEVGNMYYDSLEDAQKMENTIGSPLRLTMTSNHSLKHNNAVASTCSDMGNVEYYSCENCEKNFSDSEGKNMLFSVATEMVPYNHKIITIINAKDATYDKPGYSGDMYCSDCKKTIAYGHEIPKLEKKSFSVLKGNNAEITSGAADDFSVEVDHEFVAPISVIMDGVVVNPSNYKVTKGSTIVTFNGDYMKTLSESQHTIVVNFEDGSASAKLNVSKKISDEDTTKTGGTVTVIDASVVDTNNQSNVNKVDSTAKTGDSNNIFLYGMLAVGTMIAGCYVVYKTRKKGKTM